MIQHKTLNINYDNSRYYNILFNFIWSFKAGTFVARFDMGKFTAVFIILFFN